MFCTGGIRCEKSTAYLKSQGFKEVSADEAHKAEENIQKLTDEFIKSIDEKLDEKLASRRILRTATFACSASSLTIRTNSRLRSSVSGGRGMRIT
jgi:hypothetical protein